MSLPGADWGTICYYDALLQKPHERRKQLKYIMDISIIIVYNFHTTRGTVVAASLSTADSSFLPTEPGVVIVDGSFVEGRSGVIIILFFFCIIYLICKQNYSLYLNRGVYSETHE